MVKKQLFMNKLIYLVLSILEICEFVMHEFWNGNIKPKYNKKNPNHVTDVHIGNMMYGYTLLVPMNQRVLNKLRKERNISGHK